MSRPPSEEAGSGADAARPRRPLRRRLGGVAMALAAACAGLSLVGLVGRFIEPCDVVNQFAPFWTGAAALAAAAALCDCGRRRLLIVGVAAIALVLGAARILPEVWRARTAEVTASPGREPLKVLTFNVWKQNRDPAGTAAWILAQHADIVLMDDAARRGDAVATALQSAFPFSVRCGRHCSTVLFARRAPLQSGGLAHGDSENRKALSAAWATFSDSAGPYTVVAVHLARPWPWGDQRQQRRQLIDALKQLPGGRTIVGGDFNSTPWSFGLAELDASISLTRRTRGMFSWPARLPTGRISPPPILPIDQFYAAPSWRTLSVSRGPRLGSDHFPIVIVLAGPIAPKP